MMKQNYNHIQDFLNDDSFIRWVLFEENNHEWKLYLLDNPKKVDLVTEASQMVSEIHSLEQNQYNELDQKRVWENISKSIGEENYSNNPKFYWWSHSQFKWVSSIIFLAGLGLIYFFNQFNQKVSYKALVATIEDKSTIVERINNTENDLKLELEDGSVVTLEKGSKLSYPNHFTANKRLVILSGEAFFEIKKQPNIPFYVFANEVVTKVLGTSFRVRALDQDNKVTVKVITGKVSVYNQRKINLSDPETNALILLPNQQAIYSRPSENLSKHLVEAPMPLMEQSSQLQTEFDDVAADKILEIVEKRYGIELIYNEELLSNCVITTKLRDEALYDQLDLICSIIGASYKEVDAQIIIESMGCNK